jgi:glyoxylase-like metal-dependent hydrolase (beta-lactamase superfamily II)
VCAIWRWLLISHAHTDHMGSVAAIKALSGAPVAIHRLDAPALREGRNPPARGVGLFGRLAGPFLGHGRAQPVEPDILIEAEMSLEPFGVQGKVFPTPGHTAGSISVLLSHGEAVVGDLIMGQMLRPAQAGYPFLVDDLAQLKASIVALIAMRPTRILAAHGGPFDVQAVARAFS